MEHLFQKQVIEGFQPGPNLLITGGVHGDEFEPMAAVRRLICEVAGQSLRGRITLVPVVNESAFRRKDRCGEDDLDLARTCPGNQDGSITERTAARLAQLIQQSDYYIDLHTGGTALCVSPLAGYMLHRDEGVLEKQRSMARAFNLPIIWGTSAELEGRSLSVARDANVPAIYCEYLGSAVCHPDGVDDFVEGCLNVMGLLEMTDRAIGPSRVKYSVEDSRTGSGHLQTQNPAPCEGYFLPHVTLGQSVSTGELLGKVFDELGSVGHEVRSDRTGIVLTLRTFPRVDQGEGLAVILELASKPGTSR
ncbi:M14 family metallopeptidase [Pirellulales bacterium]|nr:M14 family metallopeptidase [Pirellulales bacterium]